MCKGVRPCVGLCRMQYWGLHRRFTATLLFGSVEQYKRPSRCPAAQKFLHRSPSSCLEQHIKHTLQSEDYCVVKRRDIMTAATDIAVCVEHAVPRTVLPSIDICLAEPLEHWRDLEIKLLSSDEAHFQVRRPILSRISEQCVLIDQLRDIHCGLRYDFSSTTSKVVKR